MVVIVTGEIGAGKTTVCRKVVAGSGQRFTCGGVLSHRSAAGELYAQDLSNGVSVLLAREGADLDGPRTGRYSFSVDGIRHGNRAIETALSRSLIIVDELGQLELEGHGFSGTLGLIAATPARRWVLVIRASLLGRFLPLLPQDVRTFETKPQSRDSLPGSILSFMCFPAA